MSGPDCIDTGPAPEQTRLKGVFSSPGRGQTAEPAEKDFWFARETPDGLVAAQLLDQNHLPAGKQILLPRQEFMRSFTVEPDLGYRLLTQRVLQGDCFRNQGMNLEAKIEYAKALRIDEENIRGLFGLGLSYLALNQPEKSRYVLEKLVALEESFSEAHKHLFNEFGIALRKKGLFDEALRFYGRARDLCPGDEHLALNIARAWYEKGDSERAFVALKNCITLDPTFREALAFLAYLRKRRIAPRDPALAAYFEREALKRSEFGALLEEE